MAMSSCQCLENAESFGGVQKDSLVDMLLRYPSTNNPIAYHLAQVNWSIFGTLTWQVDSRSINTATAKTLRMNDFRWLMLNACAILRIKTKRLAFYRKTEWGGGDRAHYNFLIAKDGLPADVTAKTLADTLSRVWRQPSGHRGLCEIEPFDNETHLQGVLYQCKYEFDATSSQFECDEYRSPALSKILQKNSGNVLSP